MWDFFRKFWPKSRLPKILPKNRDFSKKFDQNQDFSKIWLKARFSKIVTKIEILQNIRTTIEILRKFALISYFPKISQIVPKIELFRKFWSISRFFEKKFSIKIEVFRKFRKKMEIFENFDQNQYFQKMLITIEFSKIVTKIWNFLQIWPKSRFFKIFTKIKIFENLVHNRIFAKFWPKSRFFENFSQ